MRFWEGTGRSPCSLWPCGALTSVDDALLMEVGEGCDNLVEAQSCSTL